jgi:hypothetical protein
MADFDYTQLTAQNCPNRWKVIADWLIENQPDNLAALNDNYKATMQFVYDSDFSGVNPPVIYVTFNSGDSTVGSGSFVFDVEDRSGQVDSWDADYAIKVYDGTAPTPVEPTTAATVTAGQITVDISSETPYAGKHVVFSFDATDEQGESASVTYSYIYAPSAIADVAAVDGTDGTASVSFTEATGAASHTLYWMAVVGGEVAQDIVDGGTAVSNPTAVGETVATGDGDFGFVVVATNPSGSVLSNLDTVTVTTA